MPAACHNGLITIPENYRCLIWGWPNRFEARLLEVDSRVMLMGPHKKGQANSGIDHPAGIPENFSGIVFTNRIDLLSEENLLRSE